MQFCAYRGADGLFGKPKADHAAQQDQNRDLAR